MFTDSEFVHADGHWRFFLVPHVQSSISLSPLRCNKIVLDSMSLSYQATLVCFVYIFLNQSEILAAFRDGCRTRAESSSLQRRRPQEFLPELLLEFLARSDDATSRTRQARSPAGDEVTDRRILPTARRMELVGASSRACIRVQRTCARARVVSCRVNTVRYTRVPPRVSAGSPRSRIPASWLAAATGGGGEGEGGVGEGILRNVSREGCRRASREEEEAELDGGDDLQ